MSSAKQSATWDLQLRQLLLPKLGHDASECEDAIAFDIHTARFAVTDGATEAFHAQQWARNLAEHWVQNETTLTIEEFRKWVAAEGRELHDSWNGLTLSWYSEEKARTGSFAAFVGVELDLTNRDPVVESNRARRYVSRALSRWRAFEEFPALALRKFQFKSSTRRVQYGVVRKHDAVSRIRFRQL